MLNKFFAHSLRYGNLIRFSHTVFALPFALSMFVYLTRDFSVSAQQLLWIIVAVVSARTAAMSFNRLADRHLDALNPRTQNRELPAGTVSVSHAWILYGVSCLIFLASAAFLGTRCLVMAPLVLIILSGYSTAKRFSSLSHLILGLSLACAPGGVWYAIVGTFDWTPVFMMTGVLFWVAGFDIFYALQDREFDRSIGLYSIPARVSVRGALQIAGVFHVMTLGFFIGFGYSAKLSAIYFLGLSLFALPLLKQFSEILNVERDRIEHIFFRRNAQGSLIYLLAMLAERLYA